MILNELWSKHKWPIIVALTAVAVRIIYLIEISHQPGFAVPMVDEKWHWLWANDILTKSFWGEGAYFRAPLYPYFLALLVKITSGSIFWSKFLQILICGPTAWLIFKLADRLFDKSAAILAGFIYAFYGLFVFYDTMFLIPVLFIPLLVWGMYRVVAFRESDSLKSWFITGIVFGLAEVILTNRARK